MSCTAKKMLLVMIGLISGFMISISYTVFAQRNYSEEVAVRPALPIKDLRSFSEVFSTIKQSYVEPVEDSTLFEHAISGMLSNLDPHSTYLSPEVFEEFKVSTEGQFGGLGIEVGMEDGYIKVIAPIADTPAARAGILAGDLIVQIDQVSVRGMTLTDAVKRMRGKPGTPINLAIARKGQTDSIKVKIIRDIIRVESVKARNAEPGYAHIRITQFKENTTKDLVKELSQLLKAPNKVISLETGKKISIPSQDRASRLKGIVLDLRNDPGGLLNSAVGVSSVFLPKNKLVVSTKGRVDGSEQKYFARPSDYQRRGTDILKVLPDYVTKIPLVVLVNEGSASASEIVAGALQDHKRAIIMGTKTFGKGSVQTVLPLSNDGAIKLTTARYYTPRGRSIQAKGIQPDIEVPEILNGSIDPPLWTEATLMGHLKNEQSLEALQKKRDEEKQKDYLSKAKEKTQEASEDKKPVQRMKIEDIGKIEKDYQLSQALVMLKKWKGIH